MFLTEEELKSKTQEFITNSLHIKYQREKYHSMLQDITTKCDIIRQKHNWCYTTSTQYPIDGLPIMQIAFCDEIDVKTGQPINTTFKVGGTIDLVLNTLNTL